jgi:hypothetical protein
MRIELDPDELAAALTHALGLPDVQQALRAALGIPDLQARERSFMSVGAYAERIGVSLRSAWNLVREGLPTVGKGRLRRVDVAAADAWMRAGGSDGAAARAARRDASARAVRRVV